MKKSERKEMAISFIEKLHEATSGKFTTEYTLRYANSTNGFFPQYNCFQYEINEIIKSISSVLKSTQVLKK